MDGFAVFGFTDGVTAALPVTGAETDAETGAEIGATVIGGVDKLVRAEAAAPCCLEHGAARGNVIGLSCFSDRPVFVKITFRVSIGPGKIDLIPGMLKIR